MTTLPEPDNSTNTLAKASLVKESWSNGDTSNMISDGFILVGVCARTDDEDHPFYYSLIWPQPLDSMPSIVRDRWLGY